MCLSHSSLVSSVSDSKGQPQYTRAVMMMGMEVKCTVDSHFYLDSSLKAQSQVVVSKDLQ